MPGSAGSGSARHLTRRSSWCRHRRSSAAQRPPGGPGAHRTRLALKGQGSGVSCLPRCLRKALLNLPPGPAWHLDIAHSRCRPPAPGPNRLGRRLSGTSLGGSPRGPAANRQGGLKDFLQGLWSLASHFRAEGEGVSKAVAIWVPVSNDITLSSASLYSCPTPHLPISSLICP